MKVKSFTLLYTGLKRAAQCNSAWGMDLDTAGVEEWCCHVLLWEWLWVLCWEQKAMKNSFFSLCVHGESTPTQNYTVNGMFYPSSGSLVFADLWLQSCQSQTFPGSNREGPMAPDPRLQLGGSGWVWASTPSMESHNHTIIMVGKGLQGLQPLMEHHNAH